VAKSPRTRKKKLQHNSTGESTKRKKLLTKKKKANLPDTKISALVTHLRDKGFRPLIHEKNFFAIKQTEQLKDTHGDKGQDLFKKGKNTDGWWKNPTWWEGPRSKGGKKLPHAASLGGI